MKLLIFSILIGSASLVIAQENKLIKEVVISGAKKETEKQEISQTIDIISQKELQFNSAGNTGDALQNTGMITVQQSQNGGGSPIIRGFEANRIGIVVDGVRMNTAILRGGHLQNVLRVDNGQLDRAEVFYGAGSTLYGSDALGGVLNFMTIKPKLSKGLKGEVFARYASAQNEKTGGFTLNYGKEKWASVTAFTYTDFGNLMAGNMRDPQFGNWGKRLYTQARINNRDTMLPNANPNEQNPTGYIQYNVLQKFLFQPNESSSHLLNFQYSNSSDVARYDRLTEKTNNNIIDASINKFNLSKYLNLQGYISALKLSNYYSRSSALSMASLKAPISSTLYFFNTPSFANVSAVLSPVWPPMVGKRASGLSFSIIFFIDSQ